ncbi:GPI mannosyltransferase 2 [Pyronema omphalodes]|nr:GPI mannosyltransferase 2 [Pyronema omphalodes]
MLLDSIERSPERGLLATFTAWKLLLGSIVLATPQPSYDTSTALAQLQSDGIAATGIGARLLEVFCTGLTRWDAIYFIKAAERGYANEQEWAFGWGYTQSISLVTQVFSMIPGYSSLGHPTVEIVSAIIISNACHLASVFVLYYLTLQCTNNPRPKQIAWLAAVLHIISPAGLFLSAPYSESLFSFLAFFGTYVFARSLSVIKAQRHIYGSILTVLSATTFFAACTVRSNGLLNGILFFAAFISALLKFSIFRVGVLGIGGLIVGAGLVVPQYIAYQEFCSPEALRPWCTKIIPSIYTFVQELYWNVGPFRYWTLPNVPLFLLAAPTLFVLIQSGIWGVNQSSEKTANGVIIKELAAAQLLLAVMAIIGYHVQIITRLSSGCVVWYWWAATKIADEAPGKSEWIVRWMVMYALIQGVLFTAFLPPA